MKDGSLSMNAKNAKIIAQDGKITLKGPVDSRADQCQPGRECQRRAASEGQATADRQNGVGQENVWVWLTFEACDSFRSWRLLGTWERLHDRAGSERNPWPQSEAECEVSTLRR
jgi:hypothetical protein